VNEPSFPEDTTTVLKRIAPGFAWLPRMLRERFTPAAAWTAITLLALASAMLYSRASEIPKQAQAIDQIQQDEKRISELLMRVDQKLDDVSRELDRQRQWRERVEEKAEEIQVPRTRRRGK